jgi:hypothetical protein
VYEKVKANFISHSDALKRDSRIIGRYPLAAMVMFYFVILFYYLTGNYQLSLFITLFAIIAYSDMASRWIPDVTIFLLFGVSVYGLTTHDFSTRLLSVFLFMLFPVMLTVWVKIKNGNIFMASGDFYVIASVGIWVSPLYAVPVMLWSILVSKAVSQYVMEVPFITCLYFIFCFYKLMDVSGILPGLI